MPRNACAQRMRWLRSALLVGYYGLTGRRAFPGCIERLDELQYLPRPRIDAYVRSHLYRLLDHARRTVPYYRDLIDGEALTESSAPSALAAMPILTKKIIRERAERLRSREAGGRLIWNQSSGSTGEPIRLLQDGSMKNLSKANKFLFMGWAGYRMGEPHVLIWGVPKETFGEPIPLHERIYRAVHNETHLNCYTMDDEIIRGWIRCIQQRRPTFIEGYSDALYELAQYVNGHGPDIAGLRGILASGGVLTTRMRGEITKAFRCPVLNRYGSREVSDMACSCRLNHELHVSEFSCYLEIVDERGRPCEPGVEGDILVTLLTNFAMPLIRYRIEDRGTWATGPCACGRNTRRLAEVAGRRNDYLLASDGTKINGTILTSLLWSVEGVKRFQFRQTRKDEVVAAVVPMPGRSEEELTRNLAEPLAKLRSMLKQNALRLLVVDNIDPSRSGKHRYVISEVWTGSQECRSRQGTGEIIPETEGTGRRAIAG